MSERRMHAKDITKDGIPSMPARTQLDDLVDNAAGPEAILLAWAEHGGSGNQAADALTKWTWMMVKEKDEFKAHRSQLITDSRIQDMMAAVSREVRKPDAAAD